MDRREFLNAAVAGSIAACSTRMSAAQRDGTDPTSYSLSEAAALVRARKISPLELTQACLARVERLNPVLNAFITITRETALQEARTAGAEAQAGRWRGPLHGIPIALKDLFDTAGVRTTAASAIFAERVPAADAEVVRRLKGAGAILLGKLNMHEFAYGDSSAQSHYGAVRNPWDPSVIAGGSSGGSAAAVASGMCYAALGSDTGGSIRQPSAYCGIAGLKPTYGLVSTRGVVPLSWSLDHVGPMCRRVADVALSLQPLAGYDPLDPASLASASRNYADALRATVSRFRLGVPRAVFYDDLHPEIAAAVEEALSALRRMTASVRDVQLPRYETLPVVGAEAYAFHAPYFTKTPERYQPMTRRRLEAGSKVTATAYIEGRRELERLRREIKSVFAEVDLLVTPTSHLFPVTVDAAIADSSTPAAGGVASSLRNTQPFDVYGLPCISIPCGFSRTGLPIGLSISGPHLAEVQVLALAHAYERATEWHLRRPGI